MSSQSPVSLTKTVLITGASSGIGRATAKLFFARGWNVVATMRKPSGIQFHPRWLELALDVTDAQTINAALKACADQYGAVHVLVNNAGYGLSGTFESFDEAQIERQFQTNVFGLMRMCRAVLPQFRAHGGGTIVNIASMGGRIGFPYYSVYNATKWAVEGFSEALQFELEALNVRVRIVEPGAVKTDFYGRSADFSHDRTLLPYNQTVDRAAARMRKIGDAGASPERVAETIYRAATSTSSRQRYPVGKDAKGLLALRRLLGAGATYKALRYSLLG